MFKIKIFDNPPNLGDMLPSVILDYFQIPFQCVEKIEESNLLTVGSIARLASSKSTIVGSGVIRKNDQLKSDCKWISVRGPLTRKRVLECGGKCSKIFGDPALLLPLIIKEEKKKYNVGIIPHYSDYSIIQRKYQDKYFVINVLNKNPLNVVKQITQCKRIISSSLHGIIISHAYGIPASRFIQNKLHGDGVKFDDYFLSINRKNIVSEIEKPYYIDSNPFPIQNIIEAFLSIKERNA